MTIFLLCVFARSLLRGNRRGNIFSIFFLCLACGSNPGFSSNKPTHYLLDYADFFFLIHAANYLDAQVGVN